MPSVDPDDQWDARDFERSLRKDVLAGRADPSLLTCLQLIVETAKHDKAQLKRRSTGKTLSVQDETAWLPPSMSLSLDSDIEHNLWAEPDPWARSRTEVHSAGNVSIAIAQCVQPRPVQPRDLLCLQGDAKPWMGIGQRKKRCQAFHAIGQAYLSCRKRVPPAAAASVFALEQEPEVPPRPDTPPNLCEAVWHLGHSIHGVYGPFTPDVHSLVSPEPKPELKLVPHPLYPPTPPPIEHISVQPGELNVFGHNVDLYLAYVVMRGRCAMAPQAAHSLRDAAVSIMSAQHIVPGVLGKLAALLFPGGVYDFDSGVLPHDAVMDFCRG
ncbi:hypothetical protein FRC09_013850 [Ceratobasidium sp. 395]|nr:hypothetical protein FRC09_013850 [Ceratobasidium sp. 395]